MWQLYMDVALTEKIYKFLYIEKCVYTHAIQRKKNTEKYLNANCKWGKKNCKQFFCIHSSNNNTTIYVYNESSEWVKHLEELLPPRRGTKQVVARFFLRLQCLSIKRFEFGVWRAIKSTLLFNLQLILLEILLEIDCNASQQQQQHQQQQ